jgi:hypothetical protein
MRFNKSPIALAALAVCSGMPLAAQAAPTVSWSAPLSGATLAGSISGSTCAVNASSDTTRVVFWANNYQINNDYSAPWNCSFNTKVLADGSYTLKAVAYNDNNKTSTTASIPITIKNSGSSTTTNTPPSVSFTSPGAGQTVSGSSVSYAANASDNAGVSRVDFFLDGSSSALLSDSSSPYGGTLDSTQLANGSHTLTATAYDAAGLKTSTQVSFNVSNTSTSTGGTSTGGTTTTATPGPFSGSLDVWYKAPANGATISGVLNGGTSCYANTSGSPARVVFSIDGSTLNTDSTPSDGTQCVLDTTKLANGTHSMRADVYDASGNQKTDIISVNVQNAATNKAPTVSITSPTAGQTAPASLSYAANASDDVAVARVDFFLDGATTPLVSDTSSPYTGTLDTTKLTNGSHTLKATAYDAQGLNASSQVSFNVSNTSTSTGGTTSGSTTTATPAPMSGTLNAWFKAPLNGATISGVLNGGTSCYVNASGPVAKVAFSLDGSAVNTDTTPADGMQCVLDTTKFANGTHTLNALASDSSGNTYLERISVNIQNAVTGSTGGSTGGTTCSTTSGTTTVALGGIATGTTSTTCSSGGAQTGTTGGSTSGGSSLPAGGRTVGTFHAASVYWTPPSNPGSAGCIVQFRKQGDSTWRQGLNLWYDSRNSECRGSLVDLTPGTSYDVQIGVGSTYSVQTTATTWSEQFPIAQTVTVSSQSGTLNITQGGSASGYVLYQAAPGAVINGGSSAQAININASYVIVRGFTVKGGADGIEVQPGQHDVVIEQNDVSAWGRFNYTNSAGWQIGVDEDSGITAKCYNNKNSTARLIVQRNKVHDPAYGANSWDWGHPAGPIGISFFECGGNNVIRYNEVTSSSSQHYYNDSIGGGNNDSNLGAPGADSDVYGNIVTASMDDGIEAEGGGQNVRVWGNYIDQSATGVATTPVAIGPIYVYRNVINRLRQDYLKPTDQDDRNNAFKSGSWTACCGYGDGRRYIFHNTALQAVATDGSQYTLGAGGGISASGSSEPLTNTVSRNNVLPIWKTWWNSFGSPGSNNDLDYDSYNGANTFSGTESHGLPASTPVFAPGNGWQSGSGGMYQLDPSSPGYGKGVRIPNFNDAYSAPDFGAQQSGSPAMKFGVNQ